MSANISQTARRYISEDSDLPRISSHGQHIVELQEKIANWKIRKD
jgi:hypothetical protein